MSCVPHRILKTAASLLAAAWVATPDFGFSQTERERVANDEAEQRIFDAIAAAESNGGGRSAELIGPYTDLALHYLEAQNYDLALVTIADALHVTRVNSGLFSLAQVPLLRLTARVEEASGDRAAAGRLDRQLWALAKRNPDDPDSVAIFRELADAYGGLTAVELRLEAIDVLTRNGAYASDELDALEKELRRDISDSVLPGNRTLVRGDAYHMGREGLRRLASLEDTGAEPLLARVETLVASADWDLLFKEKRAALEEYEEAYALLEQNQVEQAAIDRIFAPAVPIVLPALRPSLLLLEPPADSPGYIDVGFEINKYGIASRVEVLDTSTVSDEAVERAFVRWVWHNRFRPRVVDGEIARSAPVVARYYLRGRASRGSPPYR